MGEPMNDFDLSTEIEMHRAVHEMGFSTDDIDKILRKFDRSQLSDQEGLGLLIRQLTDRAAVYKGLFDYVRMKGFTLSEKDRREVENTLREKIPDYEPTDFERT